MMDFYLIKDSEPIPNFPDDDLQFLGYLDLKTFNRLQKIGLISNRYDFYSDFRWSTDILKQVENQILNSSSDNSDIKKIKEIITNALEKNCGILAYCD